MHSQRVRDRRCSARGMCSIELQLCQVLCMSRVKAHTDRQWCIRGGSGDSNTPFCSWTSQHSPQNSLIQYPLSYSKPSSNTKIDSYIVDTCISQNLAKNHGQLQLAIAMICDYLNFDHTELINGHTCMGLKFCAHTFMHTRAPRALTKNPGYAPDRVRVDVYDACGPYLHVLSY